MDLSEKTELTWLADLVADVREAARAYEPLVVGAIARDLLLHYGLGVRIARATADIDLAFAVPDWDAFNTLRNDLLASSYFTADRPSHRLVYRGYSPVDLIPFNGVERPDGSIVWPEDGSVMGVLGYREAWGSSIEILLPKDQTLRSVSLPMLALLKLFAWDERHILAPGRMPATFFLFWRATSKAKMPTIFIARLDTCWRRKISITNRPVLGLRGTMPATAYSTVANGRCAFSMLWMRYSPRKPIQTAGYN